MYAAETEIMSPYFQTNNFSQQDIFCHHSNKPNAFLGIPLAVSDYGLWEDVDDLFRALGPVVEEPISMISSVEDLIVSPQSLAVSDVESSIEAGQLVSEVFYECRKDLLAKDENELKIENTPIDGVLGKCTSLVSLMGLVEDNEDREVPPGFLDYGIRRAFSEGDMKRLDDNSCQVQSLMGRTNKLTSICASEGRREKLSRYWSKKSKRNFDRKIKYACRKALADSQPRVRGRFAKTEVSENCKK